MGPLTVVVADTGGRLVAGRSERSVYLVDTQVEVEGLAVVVRSRMSPMAEVGMIELALRCACSMKMKMKMKMKMRMKRRMRRMMMMMTCLHHLSE